MTVSYHDDGDKISIEGEQCPECQSNATLFDRTFGFWKCEECSNVWGRDRDDPDYDEAEVCPTCLGAQSIDPEEELTDCPTCGGTGYI